MSTATAADGSYSFSVGGGGPYTLTPTSTNFVFSPATRTLADLSTDQTADFSSTRPALQFLLPVYTAGEGDGSVQITVVRAGDATDAVSVDFATSDGTATDRRDYTTALGVLNFGVGESSKSFTILLTDNGYATGSRTVNLTLSNPSVTPLGQPATAVLSIEDNDATPPATNPSDETQFFVRQHYHDFLNREPDAPGLQFWTAGIESCGTDLQCRAVKRIDTSAAFFLSIEFQETGYQAARLEAEPRVCSTS